MDVAIRIERLLAGADGIRRGMADGQEAGELVALRRTHEAFDVRGLVGDGDSEGAGEPLRGGGEENVLQRAPGGGEVIEPRLLGGSAKGAADLPEEGEG